MSTFQEFESNAATGASYPTVCAHAGTRQHGAHSGQKAQQARMSSCLSATGGAATRTSSDDSLPGNVQGIVVLYSRISGQYTDEPDDIVTDQDTESTAQAVADALSENVSVPVHLLPASVPIAGSLAPYPPDRNVVFNLYEGLSGVPDDEGVAASTLEELGYQFTGSSGPTLALLLDKAQTTAVLSAHGVLTPPSRLFASSAEVSAQAVEELRFPLMVKPVAEDSSLGIDRQAVVTDLPSLRQRVDYVLRSYHQPAFVSTFVNGREFSASIWGVPPEVLPLSEIDFSAVTNPVERIVSFAAKWEPSSSEYIHTPVICPANTTEALAQRLRATALRAYQVTGCAGYARVDMREDDGTIYVLEVNPNPALAADAGFARSARAAGFDFPTMIHRILSFALKESYACHSQS
jgi:D-alanine-D-alanine ligase